MVVQVLLQIFCKLNETYFTVPAMAVAGFKLRNAFNHFVFMDELDVDNFRSLRGGDSKSALPKNSSF